MPEAGRGQMKILIVEDNPATADLLEASLRFEGYQTVKIHAVGQAIQALQREAPDLVLLDVMMPDVSGLEFLRYLRRDPRFDHLPIMIVSAHAQPEDVERGLQAGASAYLAKPFTQEDLFAAIDKVLGRADSP